MKNLLYIFSLAGLFIACDPTFQSSDFVNPNLPPYTTSNQGTAGAYLNNFAWRYDEYGGSFWGGGSEEVLSSYFTGDTSTFHIKGVSETGLQFSNYNYLEIKFVTDSLPSEGETMTIILTGGPADYLRFTANNSISNPGPQTEKGEGELYLHSISGGGFAGTFSGETIDFDANIVRVTHGRFDN